MQHTRSRVSHIQLAECTTDTHNCDPRQLAWCDEVQDLAARLNDGFNRSLFLLVGAECVPSLDDSEVVRDRSERRKVLCKPLKLGQAFK